MILPVLHKFSPVNRDSLYLKKSAIGYSVNYGITLEVEHLYEFSTSFVADFVKIRKSKKLKRKSASCTIFNKFEKNREREPVFAWPIDKSQFRISSSFGPRKKPNGSWEFHKALDMAACKGTHVKAPAAGVVIEAGCVKGFGNTIVIAHNKKFKTRYAHLSVISVNIGQHVATGEVIGKVGCTGNVRSGKRGGDPSHLHFEVLVFGQKLNPLWYLI